MCSPSRSRSRICRARCARRWRPRGGERQAAEQGCSGSIPVGERAEDVEIVVHADANDVVPEGDILRNNAPARIGRGRVKGLAAEIDVKVFDLDGPTTPKGVFRASTSCPTGHALRRRAAARHWGTDYLALIAKGCAAGPVELPAIPGNAQSSAQCI